MKILIVSSEMVPFSKTGGLADVVGALPKVLKELGHDTRVIIPKYKSDGHLGITAKLILSGLEIQVGAEKKKANIYEAKIPGDAIVYLIESELFERDGLYQENGRDYPDNAERFIFFSEAVLALIKAIGWEPHVIHANDWQTALIPAYIKTSLSKDLFYNTIATVYTIHNMGYLGVFPAAKMPLTGLGWEYFTPDTMEFWGNVCFSKAGIVYADAINTVSETYSSEIQTEEFGHGLDGLVRSRAKDVYGILNGIDYEVWDPKKDPNLKKHYDFSDLNGKAANKTILRKSCGLSQKKDIPVIGMVSRLTDQKGFDILSGCFEEIMALGAQFVILGTGDPKYHDLFSAYAKKYPGQVSVNLGFDAAVAPLIYAGSDMFLMPSRYEPCGLGQLISFKYGTIPIVRSTGGLADTVLDLDADSVKGSGFVFKDYTCAALFGAVKRAVIKYRSDKKDWAAAMKKIMEYDYSWNISAKKYVALYKKAIENLRTHMNKSRFKA
ncbi:MAG: glycogen synthase GlgA [Candidatus Margulisiibacteriota bacterium]